MTQTFTDTAGRIWSLAIDTTTIKRVRTLLGIDLMGFVEGELMGKLMSDVVLFVDTLYAICKPQADARNVTDEQFGQAMSGEVLQAAEEALAEALFSFSHPSRREAARAVWEKAKALRERATELTMVRIHDPALDRKLEAILQSPVEAGSPPQTLGSFSTDSPAASG